MDEETQRYAAILKIKQARLFELDKQAAAYGPYTVPPHIEMERGSLQDEVAMFESAIQSPARAVATDELGPAGRFLVTHQQYRDVKQGLAAVDVKLDKVIDDSLEWREMHRNWILLIGLIVILILIAVTVLVTYLATKGAL